MIVMNGEAIIVCKMIGTFLIGLIIEDGSSILYKSLMPRAIIRAH